MSSRVPTEEQWQRMRGWCEKLEAHHKRKGHRHRVMENTFERSFASHLAQWMVDLELGTEFDWTIYEHGGSAVDHVVRGKKFDTKNTTYRGRPRYLTVDCDQLHHLEPLDALIATSTPKEFKVGDAVEFLGVTSVRRFLDEGETKEWGYGPCLNMSEDDLNPFEPLVAWAKGESVAIEERPRRRPARLVKQGRLVLDFTGGPMKIHLEEMQK